MINLVPTQNAITRETIRQEGGFAWWYLDILDDKGNGLVLIWSYGLPFLPKAGGTPADRPALNVVVYREGREAFYLLQECSADWGNEVWVFDKTTIRRTLTDKEWCVDVSVDCALPGVNNRLVGFIHAKGVRLQPLSNGGNYSEIPHRWGPVSGPSTGTVNLSLDKEQFRFEGLGYHDCNGSDLPLENLGIRDWTWGRASFGDEDRIWYLLAPNNNETPIAIAFSVDRNGTVKQVENLKVEKRNKARGTYGMSAPKELILREGSDPWLTIKVDKPVDDGPFYLRFIGTTRRADEKSGSFVMEQVDPDKVDVPWQRLFVRMKVHSLHEANPRMTSWFTGSAKGRLSRLINSYRGVGHE